MHRYVLGPARLLEAQVGRVASAEGIQTERALRAAGSTLRLGSGQPEPRVSAPFCHTICQTLECFMLWSKLIVIYFEAQNSRSYLEVR